MFSLTMSFGSKTLGLDTAELINNNVCEFKTKNKNGVNWIIIIRLKCYG